MAVVSSNSFFHFTSGGLPTLQLILQNGFKLSACDEIYGFTNIETGESLITAMEIPMICFCDIPPPAIAAHANFYCKNSSRADTEIFAIGMKRNWGLKMGLNPIAYTSPSSHSFNINELERELYDHLLGHYAQNANPFTNYRYPIDQATAFCHIHAKQNQSYVELLPRRIFYDKLTVGHYYRLNKNKIAEDSKIEAVTFRPFLEYLDVTYDHNFYDEREWRYVPHWLRHVNVFQSKMKHSYKSKLISAKDGVVFDENFANEAFYSYLNEKQFFKGDFLRYTINDVSVIVVDNHKSRDALLQNMESSVTFGGLPVNHEDLKVLDGLIMLYEEYKELEDS
jgi:hypothetical protein